MSAPVVTPTPMLMTPVHGPTPHPAHRPPELSESVRPESIAARAALAGDFEDFYLLLEQIYSQQRMEKAKKSDKKANTNTRAM